MPKPTKTPVSRKTKKAKKSLFEQFFTSKFWNDIHEKHFKAAFLDAEEFFQRRPIFGYLALMFIMIVGVSFLQIGGQWFKASVVEAPPAVDGFTIPYKEVANWAKVGGKNTKKYSEYAKADLIAAPEYNISVLQSSGTDSATVNAKITYSIVYSGKYEFDHIEYTGSHPGVDIKMPEGTPIFAIANGVVVKAVTQNSGFGYHIVVQHNNVPGQGIIFSSYSHMSKVNVQVGQIVKRGEQIGNSGDTGSSTTPHLHFQIDKATAPFHPYWPFTSADAAAAGVSFTDAVNIGVGKENVKSYTLNPFDLINKNRNDSGALSSDAGKTATPTATPTPKPATTSTPVPLPKDLMKSFDVSLSSPESEEKKLVTIVIRALDASGNILNAFSEPVSVTVSDPSVSLPSTVSFKNGQYSFTTPFQTIGRVYIDVKYGTVLKRGSIIITKTPEVASSPTPFPAASATPTATPTTLPTAIPSATPSPSGTPSQIFTDVKAGDPYANAIAFLKEKGITTGYADGSFQPNRTVSRVESLILLFRALHIEMKDSYPNPFSDIGNDWKTSPVVTAVQLGIVKGYTDGTFQADKTVNRVEYFKILLGASDMPIPEKVSSNPFADTPASEWYAPYAEVAKKENLLDFGVFFQPTKDMTRGEVAETLYRILQ